MPRIAGTAFVKIDGNQLPLKGNFTVSPSAFERTGIAGLDGVHGFSEIHRVPFIEGDISLTTDVSIDAIDAMANVTVVAELANGITYALHSAWTKSAQELNAAEGMTRVRWEGLECIELR